MQSARKKQNKVEPADELALLGEAVYRVDEALARFVLPKPIKEDLGVAADAWDRRACPFDEQRSLSNPKHQHPLHNHDVPR